MNDVAPQPARKIGRPRQYDRRINTGIRFTPEVHERLLVAAAERDLSVNWLVNRAVEQLLDRLIPIDDGS